MKEKYIVTNETNDYKNGYNKAIEDFLIHIKNKPAQVMSHESIHSVILDLREYLLERMYK